MYKEAARDLVRQLAKIDREFGAFVSGRRLSFLGSGVSTVAFSVGRDRVVRVTGAGDPDCKIINRLFERKRGAHAGWPRIFDVVNIEGDEGEHGYCVSVVERVRPAGELSYGQAFDLMGVAYDVADDWETGRRRRIGHGWSEQQVHWYDELRAGLRAIRRSRSLMDQIDVGDRNVGLTQSGHAAWIDFGV